LDLCRSLTDCGSQIVVDRTQEVHSFFACVGCTDQGGASLAA